MHFLLNIMTILRTVWQNILFEDQIKPLQILILIYPTKPKMFSFTFFILDINRVCGKEVAFWNNRHHFGRQIADHFMKYIHSDINENTWRR
jgi:hypothetical protein